MRFWLTLILGTVGVSGIVSWLYLRMEAAPQPAIQLQSETGLLPRVEFPGYTLEGDPKTIALHHDKSKLGAEYRLSVPVANRGEADLHLTLVRKTCGCVQQIFLDDAPMPEGMPVSVPPGQQKQLSVVWQYTPELATKQSDRRFAIEFVTNDPDTSVFRVQISTQVVN